MTAPSYAAPDLHADSPAWLSFIWLAFVLSLSLMLLGVYCLPVDAWIKGYLCMGTVFLTASTLTLSKTLRDRHEHERMINRVRNARTEQVLTRYGD
ncbi:YiaA/YiaB family inner membrane protein [Deinococcus hopiensis]|uniref:YiaAB two helix domain-containing protein n=1 Tax=Deinococcus hopiensis KR-140 TaxID=695939 RepID=A0A1W1VMV3_9DEIO|nr:YiaA/YiaB family inner membrane protein [Deinococcus hopiensis]SMB94284.1 hypothetical protein SAMN00790413_02323 [Deinococcus hopiensis KR-140]